MTVTEDQMIDYYAKRAFEYERVYAKPERQSDLREVEEFLSTAFSGESILEIACGTGYWTQLIAKSAFAIRATDFNLEVIELARQKEYGSCSVEFLEANAYSLSNVRSDCTAGFHGFWWSHIPIVRIGPFLSTFHGKLPVGARVIMIDNTFVKGSSTPISRTDDDGNTYQIRQLLDGSEHEVLKNFPSEADLCELLSQYANNISVRFLKYYWIVQYIVK